MIIYNEMSETIMKKNDWIKIMGTLSFESREYILEKYDAYGEILKDPDDSYYIIAPIEIMSMISRSDIPGRNPGIKSYFLNLKASRNGFMYVGFSSSSITRKDSNDRKSHRLANVLKLNNSIHPIVMKEKIKIPTSSMIPKGTIYDSVIDLVAKDVRKAISKICKMCIDNDCVFTEDGIHYSIENNDLYLHYTGINENQYREMIS